MSQLSAGIALRLCNAGPNDEDLFNTEHTVQLLSIKKVTSNSSSTTTAPDRYRIIISDGIHFTQAMLATQLNGLVVASAIVKNSVVILEKLSCNYVQDKRLIIILSLRVISTNEEKIGEPKAIPNENAAPTPNAPSTSNPATKTPATASPAAAAAPQQQQASRQQAPAKSGRHSSVYPIESLSPYQNNWTIKARVTQKSDIKTWSNQRGEGKLFNVTLMDESGEIKATGFNAVVDELYEKFQEGKVYFISKARVNLAKKKFSNLQNDYELSLERNTEVEECHEASGVPMVKYNFVQLSSLEELAKDSTCDVIAIVKETGPLSEITSRANKTIPKRELTLVDKSGYSVRLTLWGKQAEQYSAEDNSIVACKGVKVGDFGGRSLSMFSSSTMSINPDIEEAFLLRGWYDSIGMEQPFQSHSSANMSSSGGNAFNRADVRSLNDVKEARLGMNDDKADYFSAQAAIMHIKTENIAYPACPTQGCNKKVIEGHDGWRCEKCDRSFEKPEYRYIISMAVADWSGQAWVQGFNDAGVTVFGMPANDLIDIKNRDEAAYNVALQKAVGATFNFSCRAKLDSFNDQVRVRYGITRIVPLDYKEEANYLLELLRSPWAQ